MTSTDLSQRPVSLLKINIFNEQYLYDINRDDFSKVSATVIFDAEFKQKIFTEDSLYIIIGTDSGLLPKYIQQQGIPSGTRYLFVEPEQTLADLHQHHLLEDLDSEILCTNYDNWEKEAEKLKFEQYSYLSSVNLISAVCAQQDGSEVYAELNWQVSESVQTTHWKHSIRLSTELFMIRQIENIADELLPAGILKGAFKGQTAIILAGGPSLDDVLPWVRANRHNLAVLCVSRIAKQLLNANITPDFIFSVDPQKGSLDVAYEMFQFDDQPIFINSYHAYTGLLNQWQGTSLYLGNRLPWESPLNIDNIGGTGPTVTNSALSTADHFGFDTILLAGLDLCYSKGGITHALGSAEQLAGPKYNTTSLQVKTYAGEYRATEEGYYFALQTLEHQAKPMLESGKKIINLAKNAAQAKGISHVLPEDITLTTRAKTASEIAHEKINASPLKIEKSQYYIDVLAELKKAQHNINEIAKISKKANKINDTMYSNDGIIENYKDKKALDKTEKTLNKKYRIYSTLVKNFGLRQFIKITSPHGDENNWDAKKAQKIGKIYYDAYEYGANILSQLIDAAILRTQARQEEDQAIPNFELLFKQWNVDYSYNRAMLWKNRHPNIVLTADEAAEFETFAKKFTEYTISGFSDWQLERAKELGNIFFLKNKATILFKNRRITELQELQEKLQADKNNKDKEDYLCLIAAYIAILENNNDAALDYCHQIINTEDTPLLEDALNRIVSISIEQEDHKNAFLALECLAQLSPIYLPYYAESARILGETMLAIDSYISYINTFPEDIVTQLKLATLYIEYGINDAAEMMLDLILQNSPGLEAALVLKQKIKQ